MTDAQHEPQKISKDGREYYVLPLSEPVQGKHRWTLMNHVATCIAGFGEMDNKARKLIQDKLDVEMTALGEGEAEGSDLKNLPISKEAWEGLSSVEKMEVNDVILKFVNSKGADAEVKRASEALFQKIVGDLTQQNKEAGIPVSAQLVLAEISTNQMMEPCFTIDYSAAGTRAITTQDIKAAVAAMNRIMGRDVAEYVSVKTEKKTHWNAEIRIKRSDMKEILNSPHLEEMVGILTHPEAAPRLSEMGVNPKQSSNAIHKIIVAAKEKRATQGEVMTHVGLIENQLSSVKSVQTER